MKFCLAEYNTPERNPLMMEQLVFTYVLKNLQKSKCYAWEGPATMAWRMKTNEEIKL